MSENPVTPVHPGPNEKCNCGSGRKYKKCCGSPKGVEPPEPLTPEQEAALERRQNRAMARMLPLLAIASMAPPIPPMPTRHPGQGKYGYGRKK